VCGPESGIPDVEALYRSWGDDDQMSLAFCIDNPGAAAPGTVLGTDSMTSCCRNSFSVAPLLLDGVPLGTNVRRCRQTKDVRRTTSIWRRTRTEFNLHIL